MQPHDFEGRGHNRAQNPYSDRFAVADMAGQPMLATVLRVEDIDRMVALRLHRPPRDRQLMPSSIGAMLKYVGAFIVGALRALLPKRGGR